VEGEHPKCYALRVQTTRAAFVRVVTAMADALEGIPTFNRARFLADCGMEG
jgi:hypothetical protein